MNTFDLPPLLRSTIGFDRMGRLFDAVNHDRIPTSSYPPYNIEKIGDHDYRISMAVAGFSEDEMEITVKENILHVSSKVQETDDAKHTYLHRGIARRNFHHRFNLADGVNVVSADMENGLLNIELKHSVPEALKPRQIPIGGKTVGAGKDSYYA